MLRKLILMLMLPLLAACGEETDFSIPVDRSAAVVSMEMNKSDPNALLEGTGLKQAKAERLDDGGVLFRFASPEGEGRIELRVDERGPQNSEIEVALNLPRVTRNDGGEAVEYLSEDAIRKSIKDALVEWKIAAEKTRPTQTQLAELSDIVSLVGIGLQDFERFEAQAGNAFEHREAEQLADAAETVEGYSDDWGGGGDDGWGGESDDSSYEEDEDEEDSGETKITRGGGKPSNADDEDAGGGWGEGA